MWGIRGSWPGSTTGCWEETGPLSNCISAFPKAWLKEFWKLGTGTRSEPSLSPSLSAAGGASSLSAWYKAQHWVQETSGCCSSKNWFYQKCTITQKALLIFTHSVRAICNNWYNHIDRKHKQKWWGWGFILSQGSIYQILLLRQVGFK